MINKFCLPSISDNMMSYLNGKYLGIPRQDNVSHDLNFCHFEMIFGGQVVDWGHQRSMQEKKGA